MTGKNTQAKSGGIRLLILIWVPYWAGVVLSSLPLSDSHYLIVLRSTETILDALGCIPLWRVCERILSRRWPWMARVMVALIACYAFGYVVTNLAYMAIDVVPWAGSDSGGLHFHFLVSWYSCTLFSVPIVAATAIYLSINYWRESQQRAYSLLQAEKLARDAELRALRSELTPHFLFNTLNGISTLVGEGNILEARRMIARLADFLRTTLHNAGKHDISLGDEFLRAEEYLAIEQVRLGDRLRLKMEMDQTTRNMLVPALLLQPLVENSVRHGIAPSSAGGELRIRSNLVDGRLRISIANTVSLNTRRSSPGEPEGLGLKNTRERLTACYGAGYTFEVRDRDPEQWEVILEIPASPVPEAQP